MHTASLIVAEAFSRALLAFLVLAPLDVAACLNNTQSWGWLS